MHRNKLTPEERIQHRRESQRRYRAKIKLLKDEWKHYERLALDLYPTKPSRTFTQEQREFLKQLFNMELSRENIKPKNNTAINAKRQIGIALTQIKKIKLVRLILIYQISQMKIKNISLKISQR